jgi:hypothetical protein
MLDISRIDSGRLHLECATTDLAVVTADVLDRFEPQLAAAGCKVVRDLAPGVAANGTPIASNT